MMIAVNFIATPDEMICLIYQELEMNYIFEMCDKYHVFNSFSVVFGRGAEHLGFTWINTQEKWRTIFYMVFHMFICVLPL